jgi:signal peptidase I
MALNFKKIRTELTSFVFIIVGVLAFKSTVVANYTVPTGSMRTTIEPGDKLFVNKMAYDLRLPFTKIRLWEFTPPQRGDVIVFDYPENPSIEFVKRLIGLPGDLLEVEQGFISLNGKPLELSIHDPEKMLDILTHGGFYQETLGDKTYSVRRVPSYPTIPHVKVKITEGYYFAMGDNRDESSDSRSWGLVPRENIRGKAKFIYFSFAWPQVRWERIGLAF